MSNAQQFHCYKSGPIRSDRHHAHRDYDAVPIRNMQEYSGSQAGLQCVQVVHAGMTSYDIPPEWLSL